jgi:hypothetical protein
VGKALDWHSWPALIASLHHLPRWLALNLIAEMDVGGASSSSASSSAYTHASHFVPV